MLSGCGTPFGVGETLPASSDPDHDGWADVGVDNCPGVPNEDQGDEDADGRGDVCDQFCAGVCDDLATCACLDFDGDVGVPPEWVLNTAGGSTADVWAQDVRSVPRAYRMFQKGSTSGMIGSTYTSLGAAFVTDLRHVVLEYDWKLAALSARDMWSNFQVAPIIKLSSGEQVSYSYVLDPAGTPVDNWRYGVSYVENGVFTVKMLLPTPPPETSPTRWSHLRLEVVFAETPTGSVIATHDGVEVVRVEGVQTAAGPATTETVSASIGIGTLQGLTPDVTLLYDNVVFRVD